jgi:DNA-binding NtrC family response regulator
MDHLRAEVGQLHRLFGADGGNHECFRNEARVGRKNAIHVDLLITDVAMPRLGGCELLIAARKVIPDLPVIVMSGAVNLDSPSFQGAGEYRSRFVLTL